MSGQSDSTAGGGAGARSRVASPLCAAILVFLTVGYFQNSRPGWNVNSQFALVCALAEQGTLRIDDYHDRAGFVTGDKAVFGGHYYSDKSPVTPFLGVPAFLAYRAASRISGGGVNYGHALYWTTWLTIGLSAALLAALMTLSLQAGGVAPGAAASLAALWFAATPLLGFSIIFYNYLPACALAYGGYFTIEPFLRGSGSEVDYARTRIFAAGVLLGLAAWALATFALLALILTIGLMAAGGHGSDSTSRRTDLARRWSMIWPWAVGGIVGASGYVFYSLAIFGEVTNPYRYEFDPVFREQMSHGLMGAGWPRPIILWMITFHPFRGLFTLFPATLIATLGLLILAIRKHERITSFAALAYLAGMLLYNSGYYMWWGGWSYAPRHLIPALPFLLPGLAVIWNLGSGGRRIALRCLLLLVLGVGAFLNAGVVALDPQAPPGLPEEALYHPESVGTWPIPFLDLLRYVGRGQTDSNWGTWLGLRGFWSLVPLAAVWVIVLLGWGGFTSLRPTSSHPEPACDTPRSS